MYITALRKLCSEWGILPTSYTLTDDLEASKNGPSTQGGFADICRGRYKDREVAIKILRTYLADDPATVTKVECIITMAT